MGLVFLAEVQVGGYVSALKAIPVLLVLLLWTRLLTWVDKDSPAAHLPRESLNIGFLGGLVVGFGLFFFLPTFLIAFAALVFVMVAEIGAYLIIRNQKVGLGDLKKQFNDWLKSFKSGPKKGKELPNQVQIYAKGGALVPPPESEAHERPAYDAIQNAMMEPLRKKAEQVDLAPGANGSALKYMVDGVFYQGQVLERGLASMAVQYLKGAAGLDTEDKRKPQRGTLKLGMEGKKTEFRIDTAGSTAGEYMRLLAEPKTRHNFNLDTIGFTEAQKATIRELIQDRTGVVILSTPKGQGLTSLMYAVMRGHDAFLEHIHTVERSPDDDLEGITQNKLPSNASPADEYKQTDWVISQEPDIILIPRIDDSRTATSLIRFSGDSNHNRRVYVGMQANSTFEALAAWRKLVGDDKVAVQNLRLVVNGRVLRKLCNACKVGYSPDPNTLKKLGMSPEKATTLFQARTQPLRDQKGNPVPCGFCNDLRFKGRTGIFEFFLIDDEAREAIAAGASPNQLRASFRKTRGRFLQEEGLAMVEKGDTSVQEVLRVLKGGDPSAAPPAQPAEPAAV
jgi:type II secretory ATPase GspE/PulE/Tfp pilus assembly ATPase PilB-like protein